MISSKYELQFQIDKPKGLSHFLAGMARIDEVIYETNIAGAYMVPVGREVSNSLPLLTSPRLDELLSDLARRVDYVIVDAPPLGVLIDAAEIAKSCDGALLVVGYDAVHKQELIAVKEQLEQTECPILGAVLNCVMFDNYLTPRNSFGSVFSQILLPGQKQPPQNNLCGG